MSADISSNSCAKKNIDICFIELLKEKKEGDKKWFQENQIRKKKELEDFANAWEAEGFFVVRRDSMK